MAAFGYSLWLYIWIYSNKYLTKDILNKPLENVEDDYLLLTIIPLNLNEK